MGWSIRESFKLSKGTRVNVSRRGLGLSTGVKGLKLGIGSGRRPRVVGGAGPIRFYKGLGRKKSRQRSSLKDSIVGFGIVAAIVYYFSR